MAEESKEKTVKVKFNEDVANSLTGKIFKVHTTETVSEDQYKHWIKKGVSVELSK